MNTFLNNQMYVQGFLHWVFLGGWEKRLLMEVNKCRLPSWAVINHEFLREQQKCDMCKVLDSLQLLRDADMEEG